MKIVLQMSTLMTVITLAGCAGMSKQDCLTKDWHQTGFHDGANGQFKSNLAKEKQACARYDIAVNEQEYDQGWEKGVRAFCTPAKAMELGVNGQKYNPVCPPDLASNFEHTWRKGLRQYCVPENGYDLGRSGGGLPGFCAPDQTVAFNEAYHDGNRVYQHIQSIRSELNSIDRQIADKEAEISHKQRDIDHWLRKMEDPTVVHDRAAMTSLRIKVKENNQDIRSLNQNISMLRVARAHVQTRLSRAEAEG